MVERSFFTTYQLELSFVILFLVIVNIIFIYLYRYSELISKRTITSALTAINMMVIGTVIAAYIVMKPVSIEKRVMIIPEFSTDSTTNTELLMTMTQIEQNLKNSKQRSVLFMSYWWIFDALNKEHHFDSKIYTQLAKTIPNTDIYTLTKNENGAVLRGDQVNHAIMYNNDAEIFEASKSAILVLSGKLGIDMPDKIRNYINRDYIKALTLYYQGAYDALFRMADQTEINEKTMLQNLVIARAYAQKGSFIKSGVNFDNPYHNQEYLRNFVQAQRRLFVFINKDPLNPDLYLPLIELQLYQENYDDADEAIKAFLTDFGEEALLRRSEPEIYFLYSFLNLDKIKQDGYRSRLDLVKEALEIKPFLEKAYRRYMMMILKRENIQAESVSQMFNDIENYVERNSFSDSAKFILADAYLERGEIVKARKIFMDLYDKYQHQSRIHFGLGVCHFRYARRFDFYQQYTDDFKNVDDVRNEAIKNFNRAIEIDGNVNSYLYLGVIYNEMGDVDNAITNFRLRIRNKTGDIDKYADEAKKGLRKIFEDSTILRRYLEKENMLRDDIQRAN